MRLGPVGAHRRNTLGQPNSILNSSQASIQYLNPGMLVTLILAIFKVGGLLQTWLAIQAIGHLRPRILTKTNRGQATARINPTQHPRRGKESLRDGVNPALVVSQGTPDKLQLRGL